MARYMMVAMESRTAHAGVSPAAMKAVVGRYIAWGRRMKRAGHVLDSARLDGAEARLVSQRRTGPKARSVPETRDVMGGYWLIEAPDFEAALALAMESPHLEFGTIHITPLA